MTFPTFPDSIDQTDIYKFLDHFIKVKKVYDKNNLAHHNIDHIMDCLYDFTHYLYINLTNKETFFDFILAILYHDIVLIPGRDDNEKNSFKYFAESNPHLNVGERFPFIERIILSTYIPKVYNPYLSTECKIMHDLDFACFALDPDKYSQYSNNIWLEYKDIVPRQTFLQGRYKFLNSITKNKIFYYKVLFEDKAISNIKKEIELITQEMEDEKWDPYE